jgi:hypothetical protein
MSPIGSLQLTAEECNEILMKRAVAAVQNQQAITTTSESHNAREYSHHNGHLTFKSFRIFARESKQQQNKPNESFTKFFFSNLYLAISIQVQKVLQTLEDNEEQQLTHCKMEPNMGSSPKLETIEIVVSLKREHWENKHGATNLPFNLFF